MRTLALLFVLLGLPSLVANAQEADAPEGAIIEAVEMSGFSPYALSPGLQKDMDALVGAPLNRERLTELASRIEGEQPEMVAAVRSLARPDGRARVVFLVARISDDTDLTENINARYIVESVELGGAPVEVSQQLRDDLQKLVGKRLDTEEADRLNERLEDELPGRQVSRRISKGHETGTIRVVFEIFEEPWIRFAPTRSKLVYHAEQGWSGVLDIPMSRSRSRHRFTAGVVFNDIDDLIEEYSGFRLAFESRRIGTERLGARLEFSRYNQTWEDATLSALASSPGIPELYRNRLTFEPTATFAFTPSVRVNAGVSISELESLANSPSSQMANAWIAGISADHQWESKNDVRQSAEASYQLRAAVEGLDSDLVYKRHRGQARYQFEQGRSTAIASLSLGYISGNAPLFERFSLGNSLTLRGWDKYDLAPLGGERMFHSSVEYRYWHVAVFFDTGSVWDRGTDFKVRYSTGFGIHSDNSFLTVGFPLNSNDAGATFMMGVQVLSGATGRAPLWQMGVLTLVFLASPALRLSAQTLTVRTEADALHVQARGFGFVEGAVLNRLKEGRSVRVDFELTVLAKPEGPIVKQVLQGFTLSFDLWEERFAISRVGSPPRSISHLRARDAESWCLDDLTMPVTSLGQYARDAPFWIRLAYRIHNVAPATDESPGERFTLRGLIDRLSRRREEDDLAKSMDAGPFRLP